MILLSVSFRGGYLCPYAQLVMLLWADEAWLPGVRWGLTRQVQPIGSPLPLAVGLPTKSLLRFAFLGPLPERTSVRLVIYFFYFPSFYVCLWTFADCRLQGLSTPQLDFMEDKKKSLETHCGGVLQALRPLENPFSMMPPPESF